MRQLLSSERLLCLGFYEMLISRLGLAMAVPCGYLEASMAITGPTADLPVAAAKPTKRELWSPPPLEKFRERLDDAWPAPATGSTARTLDCSAGPSWSASGTAEPTRCRP